MHRNIAIIVAFLLCSNAAPALAIDVGDVFGLSSSGVGRTVTGTSMAQPGVPRVEFKILTENASEFCQRYEQLARQTPKHNACVSEIMKNARQETALVNCRTKVIVLDTGSYAKGDDHFWRSKADPNSFVLGDDLFSRSCATISQSPSNKPANAPSGEVKYVVAYEGICRFQIVSGFFGCDPRVAHVQLKNGPAIVVFTSSGTTFTLVGGRDRQPNAENYFLGINKFVLEQEDGKRSEDAQMEGECHFRLNAQATKFYSIKCDIYNRRRGTSYNFYLESIRSFSRKDG